MAQKTMTHSNIQIALFVMVVILIGTNIWQTLRLEKAVSFCTEFVKILKD